MIRKKLSIEETIKAYTNENGFAWGTNTVMKSLAPGASYDLNVEGGLFTIERWESELPQPTPQEIRDEYNRQQTIAECLVYFKENTGFRGLIKKIFK
tara:strand:- start:404 stop:694 length:291 start_codon:yes stop_codon:yes gene_type:complete